MKKNFTLLLVILIGFSFSGFAQDTDDTEDSTEKENHFYLSIELLKTIPWLMIDNAYIIEPQLEYRSKALVLVAQFGMNDIKNKIYDRMEYRNEGTYFKVGAGVDFSYYNKRNDRNNMILGGNLIFSSYKETGVVDLESNYFDDPVLIQENDSRGLEVYYTYRRVFDNNFFMNITPRIAYVMTEYEASEFPVYYVPGFGIVNVFESSNSNFDLTIGVSLKVGYRF